MRKQTKESVQTASAVGMLAAGVGLSVAGFIVDPAGEIHDSVLWFFAQCLLYAGGIFGIRLYVNGRFGRFVEEQENKK